ncbi:MAG: dTDP-4-dehydrorhamnose 3,5-epimerase [Rickettsiaceae bacterium]
MQITKLKIPEVILFEPTIYSDKRGFFFESFNQNSFNKAIGREVRFVQDNHSSSVKNVLRGLHYQLNPKAQGKLVRVLQGEIFDVAVDIRRSSSSFGQWVAEILSAENKKQLWIPEGFAHGFLVLSETAEVLYKTTDYYSPENERSIIWDDKDIGINWPIAPNAEKVIISEKDSRDSRPLKQAEVFI